MARIVVTRILSDQGALDRLTEAGHEVTYVTEDDRTPSPDELRHAVAGADGLLCMLADRIDAAVLASPTLRAVAVYAVGYDNVDLAAAREHGVAVGNTPDVLTDATADLAFALLLAVARRLPAAEFNVRSGRWRTWEPRGFLGLELRGARVVVFGGGRIGHAFGDRAQAFGADVTYVGRNDALLSACRGADVLSLHAPLTDATRGVVTAEVLAALAPGAVLVNTARGPLVDQTALAEALRSGHLLGAGLDVSDPEPLPPDHPLLAAPGLIMTPHIGSATTAAREAMAGRCVDNLLAALSGEPMPYAVPLSD